MNYARLSRRLGAFRPSVRLGKHGKPMRDPNGHDIDITADLTDGSDGALGDRPYNGQSDGTQMQTPPGTQPLHGDAKPVNRVDQQDAKPEPSLRDQLSSAFKGTDDKPTDQANAQTATPPAVVEAPALVKDGDGKYRMPDGTFASTEQVAAFEAASNSQTLQQSPVVAGLTAQEAQQFQSLPAELRQYVERTMEGLNTRASRYSEYDMIEQQLLGPRREAFAAQGTNPVVALNQLFALSDFAGRDPSNFVMWFAEQNQLDLDALLDARDAAQANVDPQVRELQGQVQQLTGQVQQFTQGQQGQTQQANLQAVENFAVAKDDKGVLLRPYVPDVMDDWAVQIGAVRSANPNMSQNDVLQKAYENACWSNPTVRGKMQEAHTAANAQQIAARVQAAKAAGSSVTGGPSGDPSTTPNNSSRSLREELDYQFAQARAV